MRKTLQARRTTAGEPRQPGAGHGPAAPEAARAVSGARRRTASMLWNAALFAGGLALGLAGAGGALAAGPHAHAEAAAHEVQLDHGRKWPTDAALRRGMTEVRELMAAALPRIRAAQFAPPDYAALAGRVQAQVDDVVANCRLPEQADRQLHVVLAQILEGAEALRGEAATAGARAILHGLDAYGRAFDHPGWRPLAE